METERQFPRDSGMRQDINSYFLFHIALEVLPLTIRHERAIQGVTITREEVKLSLFHYGIILYLKHPIEATRKLMDTISSTVNFRIQN